MSDSTALVAPSDITDPPRDRYRVSVLKRHARGSLVDRGANGGILGADGRVTHTHQREVDVTGIDNHELNALKIVDAVAKVTTQMGDVILVLKQYAYHGQQRTIHSCAQIEHYRNLVNDRSMRVGGTQHIRTNDGYIIPLDIINGLPYMPMVPPTDDDIATLPSVILTSGAPWDPKCIDFTLSTKDGWYNMLKQVDDGLIHSPFDEYGNLFGVDNISAAFLAANGVEWSSLFGANGMFDPNLSPMVDAWSGATPLAVAAKGGWTAVTEQFSTSQLIWGGIPGSIGEMNRER